MAKQEQQEYNYEIYVITQNNLEVKYKNEDGSLAEYPEEILYQKDGSSGYMKFNKGFLINAI